MNKLFFVPVGGLANRMRAVASACTLARKVGIGVSVVWFKDWALNAPFNALFQPIQWKEMAIREATFYDYWVFDRHGRKTSLSLASSNESFLTIPFMKNR